MQYNYEWSISTVRCYRGIQNNSVVQWATCQWYECMVYVSYSIYTLSVLCVLTHTYTLCILSFSHTHITLSFIVLVKVICSHIHYLGLQNGNKQDQVQNSLYNTALN